MNYVDFLIRIEHKILPQKYTSLSGETQGLIAIPILTFLSIIMLCLIIQFFTAPNRLTLTEAPPPFQAAAFMHAVRMKITSFFKTKKKRDRQKGKYLPKYEYLHYVLKSKHKPLPPKEFEEIKLPSKWQKKLYKADITKRYYE